jgi:nucleotide-binding universal stress UspA family protein
MRNKPISKILVPLDGSKNSLRGLKFALNLAKQTGSCITGLNVCYIPPIINPPPKIIEKNKQNCKKLISQAHAISKKANVEFTGIIKTSDNIGKSIVTFAETKKMDIIAIGSRGPDPVGGLFIGSVANYVIHKSKVPVTIIK